MHACIVCRTMIEIDDNEKVTVLGPRTGVARAKHMIRIVSEHGIEGLAPGWQEMDVSRIDRDGAS